MKIGSAVVLRFMLRHPPEDKKNQKKKKLVLVLVHFWFPWTRVHYREQKGLSFVVPLSPNGLTITINAVNDMRCPAVPQVTVNPRIENTSIPFDGLDFPDGQKDGKLDGLGDTQSCSVN